MMYTNITNNTWMDFENNIIIQLLKLSNELVTLIIRDKNKQPFTITDQNQIKNFLENTNICLD